MKKCAILIVCVLLAGCPPPAVKYTLSIAVEGNGTTNPAAGTYEYVEGAAVSIAGTPGAGGVFAGWEGDLAGDQNPATITMSGNKSVTAIFEDAGEVPDSLATVAYYHVEDSDGTTPADGVLATMVFEPNGVADFYLAYSEDALAYTGAYTFTGQQLSLQFTGEDFHPDATFDLHLSARTVVMPFKVFDTAPGSSTWKRMQPPLEENLDVVFRCASLADEDDSETAMERATAYAEAYSASLPAEKMEKDDPPTILPLLNGVRLQYDDEPPVDVMLYGWSNSAGTPLQPGYLASDPRIHLECESPNRPADDPREKTALFIAPFKTRKSFVWYDFYWLNKLQNVPVAQGYHLTGSEFFDFDGMASVLGDRGYAVEQLMDENAGIVNLIKALLPGQGGKLAPPGFMLFNTHGMSDGTLATGVYLGDDNGGSGFASEKAAIKAAGFGSVLTYDGGTEDAPKTLEVMCIPRDMRPDKHSYYLSLTPKFWDWLHEQGANFDRSLVYMASCLTDATPDLREAVKARAYFAFNVPANPELSGRLFQYLCKHLKRRTHTAEEAYYNILRVANTRQMIYPEDELLDNMCTEGSVSQLHVTQNVFKGYAFDGEEVASYQLGGWLHTPDADPGTVWWLVFGGRWGQNAHNGAQGMLDCWEDCWESGDTGGLANQGCENRAVGRAPTASEVGYASYLLTGQPVLEFTGFKYPRWTLNDGGD